MIELEQREQEFNEAKGPKVEKAFCCRRGKCPTVTAKGDKIAVGGKEEGFSYWTKENLADFVGAAKRGVFDDLL